MNIPKKLEEKRDAMCEAYKQECLDNWHSPGLYLKPDFKKGFEEACNLLLPEIEKMRAALKSVAAEHLDISHFENHEDIDGIKEMVRSDMQLCRKTLQSWQRFIEVGES